MYSELVGNRSVDGAEVHSALYSSKQRQLSASIDDTSGFIQMIPAVQTTHEKLLHSLVGGASQAKPRSMNWLLACAAGLGDSVS